VIQLDLPLAAPPARRRHRRSPSRRRPEALARLARYLGRRLGAGRRVRELRVVFHRRLRTAAGRADFANRTIELNPRLLDRHPEELLPTLVHELCHLVAGVRAGHGAKWRDAMLALGARPEACHRLDVAGLAVRRRTWTWRCPGCGEIYHRRHRKAHRYACGRCGRGLRLDREAGSASSAG
jgi:predicted SprT family Zn-dependent metalloprotease